MRLRKVKNARERLMVDNNKSVKNKKINEEINLSDQINNSNISMVIISP